MYRIYLDQDGDPRVVHDYMSHPSLYEWRPVTEREFETSEDAWAWVAENLADKIVNAKALRWWDTNLCFADEPSNPLWKLSEYRKDQGGIEKLCPVADICPLLNEKRACHGIVWCNVYNGGWDESHGCGPRDGTDEERRERLRKMIYEAVAARRYAEKGL